MACRWTQSASLPDGTQFDGVVGLRKLLVGHRDEFVRTLTEKLLSYALGRGIEHFDFPTVRQIARDAAPTGHRWSALVSRHREEHAVHHGNRSTEADRVAMMISKKALSRRTVLRGSVQRGVAAARQHAAGVYRCRSEARPPPINRFGVMYVPNGMIMQNWAPVGRGRRISSSTPTLAPLAPFRNQMTGRQRAELHTSARHPGR